MKRHAILLTIGVLTLAITLLPAPAFGQDTPAVTGAGAGVFPSGTTFSNVAVSGMQFGMGVFIPGDGTAAGQFQATLLGTSALNQPQYIVVEGVATSGSIGTGTGTFSGTATVDMGDGTAPLTNVPFTVTATPTSVLLTVGATNLPTASVNQGQITIQ